MFANCFTDVNFFIYVRWAFSLSKWLVSNTGTANAKLNKIDFWNTRKSRLPVLKWWLITIQ
jgi:uncharacterized protein with PQ loop repeat